MQLYEFTLIFKINISSICLFTEALKNIYRFFKLVLKLSKGSCETASHIKLSSLCMNIRKIILFDYLLFFKHFIAIVCWLFRLGTAISFSDPALNPSPKKFDLTGINLVQIRAPLVRNRTIPVHWIMRKENRFSSFWNYNITDPDQISSGDDCSTTWTIEYKQRSSKTAEAIRDNQNIWSF